MKKVLYLLPFLLSGCSSMYIPQMANAPLFEEKGETQVELSVSTNSAYASFGYACSDKYAVVLNGNMSFGNLTDYNDIFTHKDSSRAKYTDISVYGRYAHKYLEGAVGRYNLLQSDSYKLEAFVGAGYGIAEEKSYRNRYGLAFAQVDFGQEVKKFEWGLSMRLASSLHNLDWTDDYGKSFDKKFSMVHLEPMAFCRVGGEHVSFVPKIGVSLPITSPAFELVEGAIKDSDYYRTTVLHVSLGVRFKF